MALHWDVTSIKDFQTVTTSPLDEKKWHDVAHYLIFACMPLGMSGITEKNKDKFFERLTIYQRMTGPALQYSDTDTGKVIDVYVTMEDIERYVGLSVNVTDEADSTFMAKVRRWARESYRVKAGDNPDGLTAYGWIAKRAAETKKKEPVPDEDKATVTLRLPKDLAQQVAMLPPGALQAVMENYLKERAA